MGRQPAMTKLATGKRVHPVRCRGGLIKHRALRLDHGNFAWPGEATTKSTRVLDVVYNSSNNELVRTKTLVKSAIVMVDATPFRQWYMAHYGIEVGKKSKKDADAGKQSKKVLNKIAGRAKNIRKESAAAFFEQFQSGRLMACISSRPGQSGRCDGYLLEGKEFDFYMKKLKERRKH